MTWCIYCIIFAMFLIFANFAKWENSRIKKYRENYYYNSELKKNVKMQILNLLKSLKIRNSRKFKHAKITRSTVPNKSRLHSYPAIFGQNNQWYKRRIMMWDWDFIGIWEKQIPILIYDWDKHVFLHRLFTSECDAYINFIRQKLTFIPTLSVKIWRL